MGKTKSGKTNLTENRMTKNRAIEQFSAAARLVGAEVVELADPSAAAQYLVTRAGGTMLPPLGASLERAELGSRLRAAGGELAATIDRETAASAAAGVTGANFALAATGTVVLESTPEAVRLATTLPERHFVLLDPAKILLDDVAAIPLIRSFHQQQPRNFLAYITGPSRTADIERVLTIGVHGPRELHILLVPGLSADPMEL
jgi:L-lactate dehydrogenase complex protein LldG